MLNNCLECGKFTGNPKFCSRSCSVAYNNRKQPKRKKDQKREFCSVCKKKIQVSYKAKVPLCQYHRTESKLLSYGNKTAREVVNLLDAPRHKYQNIRHHAHRVANFYFSTKECFVCGYSAYTELCHIKGITEFQPEATLNQINSIDNLVYLCPNHYKDLDIKILALVA